MRNDHIRHHAVGRRSRRRSENSAKTKPTRKRVQVSNEFLRSAEDDDDGDEVGVLNLEERITQHWSNARYKNMGGNEGRKIMMEVHTRRSA